MTASRSWVTFGAGPLSLTDIVHISRREVAVRLNPDPAYRAHIQAGADFIDQLLAEQGVIYGVTTGYGDSCTVEIPLDLAFDLPHQLFRYHGCGLGRYLTAEESRAVLACRINSLAQAFSGVSLELLERLVWLLSEDLLPLIPAEGSVGASGDLTPLSYIAAVLCGERDLWAAGQVRPACEVLAEYGLKPLKLRPKEGLAIMNGTAVMTGLACLAWHQAQYLARLTCRLTSLASLGLDGNPGHFDPALFAVKPHPGQQQAAAWIWADLNPSATPSVPHRLQDRYSIRCAPHVIGVLLDALPFLEQSLSQELNSANDNPIVDPIRKTVLHGGHFYGGHVAFAMDSLKTLVANLADLMDRQMALLVDARYNHGLPSNLSGAQGPRQAINHGLKALQISLSAWTAEALKHCMPASVFSRSTECHNQDKVSMGTIAARDALRVLELTSQVAAGLLIACRQAYSLRAKLQPVPLQPAMQQFVDSLCQRIELVSEDRALDSCLRELLSLLAQQHWPLYVAEHGGSAKHGQS